MKTSRHSDRLANPNQIVSGREVRRKRTLTAFTCESLEGRKLMTGFAGATAAMMGHGPADMADMSGGQFDHGDRFQATDAGGAASTTAGNASNASDAPFGARMDLRSSRAISDGASPGTDASSMMEPHGFPGHDFAGGGMSDSGVGGGRFEVPMADGSGAQTANGGTSGNAQLDTDITKLRTDEQAIHDKSQVTPALLASVRKDLAAIDTAKTGTADATALKTLQTDEQTIFSSKADPTDAQQTQLQTDRAAVLKSQGVSQTLIDQLASDQLAVKTASNVTDADKATLDADRAAIDKDRTDTAATDGSGAAAASTPTTTATPAPATIATPATPVPTPAVAAAAATSPTTDPATAAMPTTDPTSQPVTPTPNQAAPAAVAPTAPMPMASGAVDPTATQTTTAAAMPSMTTNGLIGHHGRHEQAMGMAHAEFAHHTMTTEGVPHQFPGAGHSRRASRG